MDHHGYIEWIEKLGSRYLPVEDRRTMKNEWRTSKNGRNLREIPHGNVTETFRKRLGLDFLHGNNFSKQIRKREKCLRGWTLFHFTSPPIYRKLGEKLATQLTQASSARLSEQGCFLQKQQPSGGIFWRAQVGLVAICTPIFTKYTPSAFFWWFFFCKVTETYGFRNDTCFLSVTLRNLEDYIIIPFFDLRNVTEPH